MFRNQFGVRFYFTADSARRYTFTVNGKACTPVQKDEKVYVEILGINPQDLDQVITLTATDGMDSITVSYSPMVYIVRMCQ